MSRFRLIGGGLLASAAFVGLHAGVARAADDDFMKMAKDYIAQASAPVTTWDGPTTGPKAQGKKLVIYVSADQKNGGAQRRRRRRPGSGQGDRLGLPHPRRAGLGPGALVRVDPGDRAQARRHHSRHGRRRRAGADHRAGGRGRDQGRRLACRAGPRQDRGRARRLHQHHHRPERGRQGLRPLRRGRLGRHSGRHSVHRLDLRDRHRQDQRGKGGGRGVQGLQGAVDRGHPDRRSFQPHGAADHVAAREVRQGLDLLDRRQRPLLRLLGAVAASLPA